MQYFYDLALAFSGLMALCYLIAALPALASPAAYARTGNDSPLAMRKLKMLALAMVAPMLLALSAWITKNFADFDYMSLAGGYTAALLCFALSVYTFFNWMKTVYLTEIASVREGWDGRISFG